MFCRECGYELVGLRDRCPECGQSFDPLNPRSWSEAPLKRLTRRGVAHLCILHWGLCGLSFGFAAPVFSYWISWIVLGRKPVYPRDELASVPYVGGLLAGVSGILMCAVFPSLVAGTVLPFIIGAKAYPARGFWWQMLRASVPPTMFVLSIWLIYLVPGATGGFFMD